MKSLLLFFDGAAWLLSDEHRDQMLEADPVLAAPLFEAGLLHNFDPATWLTTNYAKEIRRAAQTAAAHLDFDTNRRTRNLGTFHFTTAEEDADAVLDAFTDSHVITERVDRGLFRVHPEIYSTIMTMVALGARAATTGFDLQLASEPGNEIHATLALITALDGLGAPASTVIAAPKATGPGRSGPGFRASLWTPRRDAIGRIIPLTLGSDLKDVGVDLTGVPLDEVLDYRARHAAEYRAYRRALLGYTTAATAAAPAERAQMARDRTEEIADHAAALRAARRSFARPAAGFTMAVAGAAWTLKAGDPVGAILAALSAAGGLAAPAAPGSAYTYLFTARDDLNRP